MRKFFKEFKEFISRGNVLDLAVAVIIGGAFSAIVTSLTDKIIMPLVNLALSGGAGDGLASAYTILKPVETDGVLDLTKSIYIDWGAFITAIINFLIIALTLFIIIKTMNASARRMEKLKNSVKVLSNKDIRIEKKEIRKQAKESGRPFNEVWAEYLEQKRIAKEEEQKKLEQEEAERIAKEKAENPTQEELLKEILICLKEKKN